MTPELAARALRIPLAEWQDVIREVHGDSPGQRLASLGHAFAKRHPPMPATAGDKPCPACGGTCGAFVAAPPQLVYGRCAACGHGQLLRGARTDAYGAAYYLSKTADGAGYDDCASEREYRSAKGRRLVQQMIAAHGGNPRRLLEVGCGLGFTLDAAAQLGLETFGVDVNPAAKASFTGTLAEARQANTHDLVLYQFVLEHVPDVVAELGAVARALAPNGLATFVVPSMEALEIDAFGGAYRSFRADHLNLFTARSMAALCERVGLRIAHAESTCSLHLLAPALSREELDEVYRSGRGPDLVFHVRSAQP